MDYLQNALEIDRSSAFRLLVVAAFSALVFGVWLVRTLVGSLSTVY